MSIVLIAPAARAVTGTPPLGASTLTTGNDTLNSNRDGIGEANKSHSEREPNDKNCFSRESCNPDVDLPTYFTHGVRDTPTACLLPPSQDAWQAGMQKRGGNVVDVFYSPASPDLELEELSETIDNSNYNGRSWTNTGHGIYSTTDINTQVSDLSAPLSSTTTDITAQTTSTQAGSSTPSGVCKRKERADGSADPPGNRPLESSVVRGTDGQTPNSSGPGKRTKRRDEVADYHR